MDEEQLNELADAATELRSIGMFSLARTVDDARTRLVPHVWDDGPGAQLSLLTAVQ